MDQKKHYHVLHGVFDVRLGYANTSKQGPLCWLLNGKTLWDMRKEICPEKCEF